MNQELVNQLLSLNRQFYQTFAIHFSATRMRLQPGIWQILKTIPSSANILDIGCGNGTLWRELDRRAGRGFYVGLDSSSRLLEVAAQETQKDLSISRPYMPAKFILADLAGPGWDKAARQALNSSSPPPSTTLFDFVLAFAVLHHLPGYDLRLQSLKKVHSLLAPGGRFIHSEWQFMNSPRLRSRIQPWNTIEISQDSVDPGDYLLDWRQGGAGLRYVHLFSEAELAELAAESGFNINQTFYSDGEGGTLGLYQVWEKREPDRVTKEL